MSNPHKKDGPALRGITGIGHNLLRADNLERYIIKLEETLTLKGLAIKPPHNEIIEAIFKGNGLITADPDVFLVSKLYFARAKMHFGLQHLAIVDSSFDRYFTFEDFCSEMRRACVQQVSAIPQSAVSSMSAFDLIARLRKLAANKKPLCVIFLHLEDTRLPQVSEAEALMDFIRTTFLTAETRVIAARSNREQVLEELNKLLPDITPGGYFS